VKDTAQKARWEEANTAYPEFGEMMTAITRKLIDRQDVKFVDGQAVQVPENVQEQFDSMAELKGLVDSMQVELDERKYFDAIEAEVPGAKAISGSKEFISWLDGQSVGINSLADSGDPVDAVQVMKAYNEHKAHQTAKVVDEAALKKKKKNVSSLRPAVKTSPSRDRGNNQDDFDGAFNS
jgi:beta-phosphoglucomutase-like phosphatase (HAD superfamily)